MSGAPLVIGVLKAACIIDRQFEDSRAIPLPVLGAHLLEPTTATGRLKPIDKVVCGAGEVRLKMPKSCVGIVVTLRSGVKISASGAILAGIGPGTARRSANIQDTRKG